VNPNWTRTDCVTVLNALAGHAEKVLGLMNAEATLRQQWAAVEYKPLIPGSKAKAVATRNALEQRFDATVVEREAAQLALRTFYAQIGGPDFYPQDFLEPSTIRGVAEFIAHHRANSIGEGINLIVAERQSIQAQRRHQQTQAAADRRHRQNMQHRQGVANRAILWDMWRDWR